MLHRFSAWILGLDPFWRDIIKMVLDKLLLGGVAAWIVYRFARSLEKQKGRNAAAAKRVELRDGAITSAWHALRKLEIEIARAELELTTGSRQLSQERAQAVDNAQSQAIEMVGVARPRIPSDLFTFFVDLHNARIDLLNALRSLVRSDSEIDSRRAKIRNLEAQARDRMKKCLGSVPED